MTMKLPNAAFIGTFSREEENKLRKVLLQPGDYGALSAARIASVAQVTGDIDAALSLRQSFLKDKTMMNHSRIKAMSGEILKHFNAGLSIKELVARFDGSPVQIFRIVFLDRLERHGKVSKASKVTLKKAVANPELVLSAREIHELNYAEAHDQANCFTCVDVHVMAMNFENEVVAHFLKYDPALKTQEMLVQEQMTEEGLATATPDILFSRGVRINGHKVNWIDCKNYYLYGRAYFNRRSIINQVEKYHARFGPGALVLRYGFSDDSQGVMASIKNKVILINWSAVV